jgi:hypothetical protein
VVAIVLPTRRDADHAAAALGRYTFVLHPPDERPVIVRALDAAVAATARGAAAVLVLPIDDIALCEVELAFKQGAEAAALAAPFAPRAQGAQAALGARGARGPHAAAAPPRLPLGWLAALLLPLRLRGDELGGGAARVTHVPDDAAYRLALSWGHDLQQSAAEFGLVTAGLEVDDRQCALAALDDPVAPLFPVYTYETADVDGEAAAADLARRVLAAPPLA